MIQKSKNLSEFSSYNCEIMLSEKKQVKSIEIKTKRKQMNTFPTKL